jgi:hypothetical protein
MKITVVANKSGEVIAAVVHTGPPMSEDDRTPRVKPTEEQEVVTVDAPEELTHRVPDAEYLDILRARYTIKDGYLQTR